MSSQQNVDRLYAECEPEFGRWEVIKDVVDEMIDLMLNYRQSGHPGGSRSKVHAFVALALSGAMRWDIRRPWRPFCDRFVLSAGHTVPLVYAGLAVLNQTLRLRHERTGDERFAFPLGGKYALTWEDLLVLRRNQGLAGHAEMEGKTLFLKWNTGPSGHGMPAAAGEAMALKRAGAGEVKVFAMEGEGGLTPGASHETRNTAWGLGLDNLVFLIDWNDYGIDDNAISSVVNGTPTDWFAPYGWRVCSTERGSEFPSVARTVLDAAHGGDGKVPSVAWFKTRKGRGYLTYDNKSHGAAHASNSEKFWTLRKQFMDKYGVEYAGVDQPAPAGDAMMAQAEQNLRVAMSVLERDRETVDAISDRLIAIAESVPDKIEGLKLAEGSGAVFEDERLYDFESYPESMWAKPGESQPNRTAFAKWGSWVNSFARKEYGRPVFLVCSADLAASTNINGFAQGYDDDVEGWGWYNRETNLDGALLPQQITEFTNAGLCVGIASVNLADDPMAGFNGFWAGCSTYGSFSYLKYGPMRLFSQLAQDCDLKVGKVIWVAGHSGPETAEDSRTHFGIFAPGVTQLFPEGHVIDLHPWEYNEVPVVLAAALKQDAPIVALHLTRPKITIPDREALGMPSHFAAAKGAYVMREYRDGPPKMGTVFVQGTSTTANLVEVLPELDARGLNVKIVAAISPQLFALQDQAYRDSVCSAAERYDAMVISNRALRVSRDWVDNPLVAEYSLTSDWDDRWRTGGSVDEVIAEAHLSPGHILAGIERFAKDRGKRVQALRDVVGAIEV